MYFTEEKKIKALEEIRIIYKCAKEAGIEKAVFVGFGLLLGIVRESDFIKHDDDVDMCVRSDLITAEQELKYYNLLLKNGMFGARRRLSFRETSNGFKYNQVVAGVNTKEVRFTWFSLRKKVGYPKFCHWFFFPWNGYYWHTKSGKWVNRRKFNFVQWDITPSGMVAVMKGIPADCFDGSMEKIRFYGIDINIPAKYGTCLDFWYPGWRIPKKGGASAKNVVCTVNNWHDQTSWIVKTG